MNITVGAQILIVEDSVDLNSALCEILASYGYRVQGAHNGYEALERLHGAKPDVILCDIMMPGMDGYTLLQRTRSDVHLRTLPFIFLTALSSTAEQRRAKEIGIDDYLTKPIDSSDLVIAIENALNRHRMMEDDAQRKLDELHHRIVGLLQHEFRTPLTVVLGYAELIANTTPTTLNWDELRLAASAILDGGHRLQALIEGFLLLAALQNRMLNSGDLECLEAVRFWHDLAREFAPAADAANLQLEIIPITQPACVTADEYLVKESLRRLVDNAIRYRRPQSCRIRLSVVPLLPYIGLRIEDDGQGMRETTIADILHAFEPAENHEQMSDNGAGLSLALVKHIVRMHGGQLQVDSTYGEGSTFVVWLPAAAPTQPI